MAIEMVLAMPTGIAARETRLLAVTGEEIWQDRTRIIRNAEHTGTTETTGSGRIEITVITRNTAAAIVAVTNIGTGVTATITTTGGMLGRGGRWAYRYMFMRRMTISTTTCTLHIVWVNTDRTTRLPTLIWHIVVDTDAAGAHTATSPVRASTAEILLQRLKIIRVGLPVGGQQRTSSAAAWMAASPPNRVSCVCHHAGSRGSCTCGAV